MIRMTDTSPKMLIANMLYQSLSMMMIMRSQWKWFLLILWSMFVKSSNQNLFNGSYVTLLVQVVLKRSSQCESFRVVNNMT